MRDARPVTVTLSFEEGELACVPKRLLKKRRDALNVIKRRVSVSTDAGISKEEFFDIFDAREKRFLR